MIDFPLGQVCDVYSHPTPSFCAEIAVHHYGRVSERYVCRLASPSGPPDTDNDHVKCDGDDGCDLLTSDIVSEGLSLHERVRHDGLTMSRITY